MELLRSWVNDDLQLSRHVNSFEKDMANGYLIGEILARHGLLRSMDALQKRFDTELSYFRLWAATATTGP